MPWRVCVWCYAEASSRIRRARLAASSRDATGLHGEQVVGERSRRARSLRATDGRSVGQDGRSVGRSIGRTGHDPLGGDPERERAVANNRGLACGIEERATCAAPLSRALSRRCARSTPRIARVCVCDHVHAPGPAEVGCQRTAGGRIPTRGEPARRERPRRDSREEERATGRVCVRKRE